MGLRGILPFCLLLFPAFLHAQSEVGGASLNGTVSDSSGAVVQRADVVLTSGETGFSRQTTTNETGLYNFVRVPVGTYSLSIKQAGFKPFQIEGINLSVGASPTFDVQLQVGSAETSVSVTADVPIVETGTSATSTTVNEKQVADLPVNGRNFLDFTTLTPGVVRDPTRGGDLSFGGQRGTANSLLVDGGEANNLFFGQAQGRTGFRPYAFSQDAVQEFQVNASDYPAEIGRAGGGVVNAVTKSGTNQFHGDAFEFYRDKALNANTFINNRAGVRKQPYHFNQFGGTFGGPIVKDKVFFLVNYDGQRNTVPNVIVLTSPPPASLAPVLAPYFAPYTTGQDNDVFLAKLDWNISSNDRVSVRYNGNRFTGKNFESFGTSSAAEHTGNSEVTTDNLSANYSHVFGPNMIYDSRYVFVRDLEPGAANSTAPEVTIQQGGINQISFGRNNFSPRYTNVHTGQSVQQLSIIQGRHTFKFGADFDIQKIDNYFPGLFSGSYLFASYADFAAGKASRYQQNFPGPGTSGPLTNPNQNEYAFFAQDSFRATDRLTLNYGVRYDLFQYGQPSVLNTNSQLVQQSNLYTNEIRVDLLNFAPRFGFAYKPFSSYRMVIRGGYGIYYARTPSIATGTAFSQNAIQVQSYTLTANLIPTYPNILAAPPINAPQNIFVFEHDYATPRTQQYSLNVETEVSRDASIEFGFLGVGGCHLGRTRDINLFPEVALTGKFADGTPVTYFRHPSGRPNSAFVRVQLFDSGASSNYYAGFVQFTKRYAHNFAFLTSYTYSKVLDSNPDQTAVVVGADDSKIVQDTLNPNNDYGPGNADIRHRLVFSGLWDIPFYRNASNPFVRYVVAGWQFSTITQAQSGRPFNVVAGGDSNGDGNTANDRVPGIGRNTLRGPWFVTDDVRLSKDVPLAGERVRLRLIGEAFNVTNRSNFNAIQNTQYSFSNGTFTPRTDFLRRLTTFDPRILQLSAKIIF
jgi:hypothetical protein